MAWTKEQMEALADKFAQVFVEAVEHAGGTAKIVSSDASQQEWVTVTRAWPSPVPSIAARRVFDKGRYFLMAKWKTVEVKQAEML